MAETAHNSKFDGMRRSLCHSDAVLFQGPFAGDFCSWFSSGCWQAANLSHRDYMKVVACFLNWGHSFCAVNDEAGHHTGKVDKVYVGQTVLRKWPETVRRSSPYCPQFALRDPLKDPILSSEPRT